MKYFSFVKFSSVVFIFGVMFFFFCAEEGQEGDSPLDCGDHGTEHDGHCHCDEGYLFDGETCVEPEEISEICGEESDTEGEEEHEHACVCPEEGECPCDHGEIVTIGGQDYCAPVFHEE